MASMTNSILRGRGAGGVVTTEALQFEDAEMVVERLFGEQFGAAIAVQVARLEHSAAALPQVEAQYLEAMIPQRRQEFTAGRSCARLALTRLGGPAASIPRDVDRAPQWPDGFVGSITHCHGFCAAAVARDQLVRGLGIDAEVVTPMDAEMARFVWSEGEEEDLPRLASEPVCGWAKLLFSIKESLFKCLYQPLNASLMDFRDIRVSLGPQNPTRGEFALAWVALPEGRSSPPGLRGFWFVDEQRVYSGAILPR